ncbi:hypothetical protein [Moellerella wisconsensis]|nr:hypothetical protein [Moellerella wisconsensis]
MSEEGNKYFKGGEPTWANACVGENGNPSYTEYYKGYSKAANVLLDAVISDKGVRLWLDDFIYPICFNFRHSIELRLKDICQHYISEIFTIKNTPFSFDHTGSHDIGIIWEFVKQKAVIAERNSERFIEEIDEFIIELSAIDATGQVFRYPFSKRNEKHLVRESIINVIDLKTQFNRVESVLDKFSNFMSEALDNYRLGYFSGDLSRNDLIDIANHLPDRNTWREPLFKQVRESLKSKYALSNRAFSKAIAVIENTHDLAKMIGLELPLYGCDKDTVRLAFLMSGFYLRRSSINELVVVNGAINPCDGNNAEKIKNRIMASLKRRTILERKFRDRFDSVSISGLLALFYSNQGNSKDYQREYERRARYEANFEDLMHVVEKLNFPFEVVKNLYSLGYVELADELKLKFISNPDFLKDLE